MVQDADALLAAIDGTRNRFLAAERSLAAEHPDWDPALDARLAAFTIIADALGHAGTALSRAPGAPDGYARFVQTACLGAVMGGTEVFFRSVIRALAPDACNRGAGEFKGVYDAVLARVRLRRWIALLDLLRVVRNTIHNHGVYLYKHPRDHAIVYKGRRYPFALGRRVEFITWDLLLEWVADLARLLEETARSPRVSGLRRVPVPGDG